LDLIFKNYFKLIICWNCLSPKEKTTPIKFRNCRKFSKADYRANTQQTLSNELC